MFAKGREKGADEAPGSSAKRKNMYESSDAFEFDDDVSTLPCRHHKFAMRTQKLSARPTPSTEKIRNLQALAQTSVQEEDEENVLLDLPLTCLPARSKSLVPSEAGSKEEDEEALTDIECLDYGGSPDASQKRVEFETFGTLKVSPPPESDKLLNRHGYSFGELDNMTPQPPSPAHPALANTARTPGGESEKRNRRRAGGAAKVSLATTAIHSSSDDAVNGKAYAQVKRRGYSVLPPQEQLEDKLEVRIGAKCTAYDQRNRLWYMSSIVELDGAQAKIHYSGWDKKYDSWVEISSLEPSVKIGEALVMDAPLSLVATAILSKSVKLEVCMRADAQKVQGFYVKFNGFEDQQKIKTFTVSSSAVDACCRYVFEYTGLDTDTEYELQVIYPS